MQQDLDGLPLVIIGAGCQLPGSRSAQEDSFLLIPSDPPSAADYALAILADGMGGHADGAAASRETAASFAASFLRSGGGNLKQALDDANASLGDLKRNHFIHGEAGSTLLALSLEGGFCSWISVGDSLLYLFREGKLIPLNEKHTWRQRLDRQLREGVITQRQADASPQKNALYSVVCGEDLAAVDYCPRAVSLRPGDRFLLASDGLNPILPELEGLLCQPHVRQASPADVCGILLQSVERKKAPRQDNATVVILDVADKKTWFDRSTPVLNMGSASFSHPGDRDSQQDAWGVWSSPRSVMAVVADGAGGHEGGAQASSTAVAILKTLWEQRLSRGCLVPEAAGLISQGMLRAHHDIIRSCGGNPALSGKCAIVALYACGGRYAVIHVGDCRLYQGTESGWVCRTEDDSILQKLLSAGRIRPEEAPGHPDQGVLTQALGASAAPEPHVYLGAFSPDDSFLLCCDGFWNQLPRRQWAPSRWGCRDRGHAALLHNRVEDAVRAARGNSDNVTAVWLFPPAGRGWTSPRGAWRGKKFALLAAAALLVLAGAGWGGAAWWQGKESDFRQERSGLESEAGQLRPQAREKERLLEEQQRKAEEERRKAGEAREAVIGRPAGKPMKHDGCVESVTWRPAGKSIAPGGGGGVRVWDAATGRSVGEPMRHESIVTSVAWSLNGGRIASGGYDHTVLVWEALTGRPVGEPMRHESEVTSITWSPDGAKIASGSWDGTVRVWDAATGRPVGKPMEHDETVTSVTWSPDGAKIASGNFDTTVLVWDALTGCPVGEPMKHGDSVYSVTWSPDGTKIASGSFDGSVRVWDAATGRPVGTPMKHGDGVWSVSWSPDGTKIASGGVDCTVRVWDAATGRPVGEPMRQDNTVRSVTWSPDGTKIASGSEDKTVRVWDAATGRRVGRTMKHDNLVRSVTWSPDGTKIASGGVGGVRGWDAATGRAGGRTL